MQSLVAIAKQLTKEKTSELTAAMECIPQEQHHWVPDGCVKTAMQIYLECAGEYLNMAKFLRGDTLVPWEEVLEKATARVTLDDAMELMKINESDFLAALDELDECRLDETVELPWGGETTRGQFIFLPSYHIAYHCGQLNYIQTLLRIAD